MKKLFKNLTVAAMFVLCVTMVATPVLVSASADALGFNYVDDLGLEAGTGSTDPRELAVNIVQFFMTFLGIIAVVIILYGGFMWMTAAGNDDKVATAKKIIVAGAIGLAIILASYVIVNFVINTTGSILEGDISNTAF